MERKRLWRTLRMICSKNRDEYVRRAGIFAEFGENSTISSRVIPLYPELISIGNNVRLAAKVTLIPHDMIHAMLNNRVIDDNQKHIEDDTTLCNTRESTFREYMGCIRIDDNVFVGACSTILADVHIGSNVIIGAGTLVNKDLEGGYVYAGVPAKKICSMEEFIKKREMSVNYPTEWSRCGDSVPNELKEYLWNEFWEKRCK